MARNHQPAQAAAKRHHRSLQGEAKIILEEAAREMTMEEARKLVLSGARNSPAKSSATARN